jgi:hypothetical protein
VAGAGQRAAQSGQTRARAAWVGQPRRRLRLAGSTAGFRTPGRRAALEWRHHWAAGRGLERRQGMGSSWRVGGNGSIAKPRYDNFIQPHEQNSFRFVLTLKHKEFEDSKKISCICLVYQFEIPYTSI